MDIWSCNNIYILNNIFEDNLYMDVMFDNLFYKIIGSKGVMI